MSVVAAQVAAQVADVSAASEQLAVQLAGVWAHAGAFGVALEAAVGDTPHGVAEIPAQWVYIRRRA